MVVVTNYAEKYADQLAEVIKQGSLTAALETPKVNWLDAQTFKVQKVSTTGYGTHSRNGGFNAGEVTVSDTPYTLAFDRDVEFFVDRADVDETNQAASAANVTKDFMNSNAIPEIDAYRFSKIATKAIAEGKTASEALTVDTVFDRLKAALLPVRKYGPANIVVYVSSEVMDLLERSTDFTRQINVSGNAGSIETRVTAIDGVQLLEVWDFERFKTAFNFTVGFAPAAGALDINFLVVAKPAIIAKAKLSYVKLWEPGTHQKGDGFLYQNRLYHDLFVDAEKVDGVYVSTKPAAV